MITTIKGIIDILVGLKTLFPNFGKNSNDFPRVEPILFNYPSEEFEKQGWLWEYNHKPMIESVKDKKYGKYITVIPKDTKNPNSGYIQSTSVLSTSQIECSKIKFIVRIIGSTGLYVKIQIHKSSEGDKSIWLKWEPSSVPKKPKKIYQNEWQVFGKSKHKGKWSEINMNFKDILFHIDELEGFEFSKIEAIRIRGQVEICKIEFAE